MLHHGAGAKDVFRQRLKQLRTLEGLNQEEFADKLGVSRGSISFYENGSRTPDIDFLDRLYRYYEDLLPADFLLGYTDNIKTENQDIGLLTGLNDCSLDKISWCDPDILNKFFCHDKFDLLVGAIHSFAQDYKPTTSDSALFVGDYKELFSLYLIGEMFKKIVYEITQPTRTRKYYEAAGIDPDDSTDLLEYIKKSEMEYQKVDQDYRAKVNEIEQKVKKDLEQIASTVGQRHYDIIVNKIIPELSKTGDSNG